MRATVKPIRRTPVEIRQGRPAMLRIVLDLPGGVVTMFEKGGPAVAGDRARGYMRAVATRLAGQAPPRLHVPMSPEYAMHYAQNPADLGEHSPEL